MALKYKLLSPFKRLTAMILLICLHIYYTQYVSHILLLLKRFRGNFYEYNTISLFNFTEFFYYGVWV